MSCAKKKIKDVKLCIGDLNSLIQIQERRLPEITDIDDPEPSFVFTTILSTWSAVETIRGTSRFSNVNIEDSTTHLFWIRYNPNLSIPENGNTFILFKGRYFRIIRVTNSNEQDEWVMIEASDRGDITEQAAVI